MQVNQINRAGSRKQSGASLFEALMFIVVSVVVLAGVVAMGVKVFDSSKEKDSNDQIIELSTNIKAVYAGQNQFGTASENMLPTLAATNKIPASITLNGAGSSMTATNVYGGGMTVNAGAAGALDTYIITYGGLDDDVCIKLASKIQPGWKSLKINSGTAATTLPITPATAAAGCTGGAASNTLTLTGR